MFELKHTIGVKLLLILVNEAFNYFMAVNAVSVSPDLNKAF